MKVGSLKGGICEGEGPLWPSVMAFWCGHLLTGHLLTATEAGSIHPTVTHSCFSYYLIASMFITQLPIARTPH